MFRGVPQILRCLASMPMLFWGTITAAARKSGGKAADERSPQDCGLYFADDPWAD